MIAAAVAALATVLVPASPAWVQISIDELREDYDELWAMDAGGSFVKLDTGLKTLQSTGLLLRCEVANLVCGKRLALRRRGGPTCRALGPDATLRDLLVK